MLWKRKLKKSKVRYLIYPNLFSILKHDVKDTGNVKRESKNYTYKEQMAARELEKELAAKQKAAAPQLTKKQQEMLQQHLDQEQAIRDNVKKVKFNL